MLAICQLGDPNSSLPPSIGGRVYYPRQRSPAVKTRSMARLPLHLRARIYQGYKKAAASTVVLVVVTALLLQLLLVLVLPLLLLQLLLLLLLLIRQRYVSRPSRRVSLFRAPNEAKQTSSSLHAPRTPTPRSHRQDHPRPSALGH